MTRPAFAVGCIAAAVLLSAVACGATKAAGPAATSPAAARGPAAASPASGGCPTRGAWATEVTAAGRVAWQVKLPTDAQQQGVVVQPLVIGGVAVFAEENAVYGIRVSDGHQLWRRAFSKAMASVSGWVYGLWASGDRVVVLSGQVSADARLTALNVSTGAVGWTLRLPAPGLLGSQAQAGDGTLAVLRPDGVLESVNLASGRVLWSRQVGQSLGPAAVGPVVAAGGTSRAVGYAGRGGGDALWAANGLPPQTNLTAAGGLFLAWSDTEGGGSPTAVTALNPRTGRVEWRFDPGPPVTILGAGPAGIALATYVPTRRLYLVNPATGRVRWSASTFAAALGDTPGQLIETSADMVLPEENVTPPAEVSRLVARAAADGRVLWAVPLAAGADGLNLALLSIAGGRAIAVTAGQGSGFSENTRLTVRRLGTGRPLASVTLPDMVLAPLTVTGTSVLAQSDSLACAAAFAVPTRTALGAPGR
jgi:outer membrane protein assembly factor BamB